jgi:rhodanese-related sulfurtransferase
MSRQISPGELAEALKSPHPPRLLDVREIEEHLFAALPQSKLIPLGELGQRVGELTDWKGEEIVVYCHHGIRSLHAIGQLQYSGFANLRNLAGGLDRWSCEVDPAMPRY